ncbi:MAG TPA: hypothetical protein V6D22_12205 [Candidatus Obscuribacterales bacterium]
MNEARLDISDCTFGELNALMESEAIVRNSTCDGSGGYILVANKTKVSMVNCTLNCPVVATDEGKLVLNHCRVNGDTSASDNAVIILQETILNGRRQQLGNGRIVEES